MTDRQTRIGVSLPGPFWVSWRSTGFFAKVFAFIIIAALVWVAFWLLVFATLIVGIVGTAVFLIRREPRRIGIAWLFVPRGVVRFGRELFTTRYNGDLDRDEEYPDATMDRAE